MPSSPRFIFRIDHLSDDQMAFYGWVVVDRSHTFKLYRREHDGEHVVVQNDPPRWFVADDPNDAQQMCDGQIFLGPDGSHGKTPR